ncbi:hypothetical protein [Candidatus Berkiella aquae]|uniref:Uncharacterized protein n=1 Tax=Candidatus Berkiella aquae TaxID=295108 RepID=A0A0Q9YXH9_9GAMM|nr:hypothetical protein [Candidatus Berkiella aquae]MCS5711574.1 hypothetical protein [Candidatus Berkiella aquae]
MVDVSFMKNKFSIDDLVEHYLAEIKNLRQYVKTPQDESKLQTYYQAVSTFKRISVKELVQFALSYGRQASGKAAQMQSAFPIILGNRVHQPSQIDVAYAQLLLEYTKSFKIGRSRIKDWMLRFILSSRFSPISQYVEREIVHVIENTEQNVRSFKSQLQ